MLIVENLKREIRHGARKLIVYYFISPQNIINNIFMGIFHVKKNYPVFFILYCEVFNLVLEHKKFPVLHISAHELHFSN